ncbi:hypothetical protein G7050_16900 [Dysgonomonas sp. HDW5A]|uniref:hypothetical protein n=1 Tax=Dysgonomonas sp. HDW5A TaxID=2714926 RepID=UPI00140A468C|nr:hypothetical protein [Dysgonomonas sp. HDW5A]QIK61430.1 hypothetical protein G7050_16900 [Dysgonomonas sp. HDW5A]
MTTVKKIILFLFGIVLIVFGNKAAIDTIFKNNDGLKVPDSGENEIASKNAVITEEIETKEVITKDNAISSPEVSEVKAEEISKKEAPKKTTEKALKEQPTKTSEKKDEQKVKEAPKTKIEPVKEETAAASE